MLRRIHLEFLEIRALLKGQVQGVGFRVTARDIAKRLNLMGTVQNLPDGSVKIVVQGLEDQLDLFLQTLTSDTGPGQVLEIKKTIHKPIEKYIGFQIL